MKGQRFVPFILSLSTSLCIAAILLHFFHKENPRNEHMLASYTYEGPTQPVPGNPHLVRIEVILRDSPVVGGVQIKSAHFNGQNIPLQPRDIYGNRGTGSFQVPPGKYKLRWVVQKDKFIWPRTISHEEEVTVDPRDLWLQIEIVGDEASIR